MKEKRPSQRPSLLLFVLGLSLTLSLMVSNNLQAQEEPLPENSGMAGPSEADIEAQQGMDIEEGLEPETAPEVTESQQSFENKKAEEELEIEKEKADAQEEMAEAAYDESLEPTVAVEPYTEGAAMEVRPVVEPEVVE
jgi:hypothetical protein